MNANALWAGQDYAYVEGRGRGQNFSWDAQRVKVIKVYKDISGWGRERATTMVEALMLNDDGTPLLRTKWNYETRTYEQSDERVVKQIRARDIINHWEDYARDRIYRERERERLREIEREKERKEAEKRTRIIDALEALGLKRNAIRISNYSSTVTIDREELEAFLHISHDEETEVVRDDEEDAYV